VACFHAEGLKFVQCFSSLWLYVAPNRLAPWRSVHRRKQWPFRRSKYSWILWKLEIYFLCKRARNWPVRGQKNRV